MSRADSLGLFWEDVKIERLKKVKEKRTPPPRTWEDPSYLPYINEARAFSPPLLTDDELAAVAFEGDKLLFDVEVYPNYFLAGFKSYKTGKVLFFERAEDMGLWPDFAKLEWIMKYCPLIGFNSRNYDLTIIATVLANRSNIQIKGASDQIIQDGWRPNEVLRAHRAKALDCNHIDLIEVAPLRASLKVYGGRMHARRMQDLPFRPDTVLTEDQILVTRYYNINDLDNTGLLYHHLSEQIQLRELMSQEYGADLRSKSDAQIAETVISSAVSKLNGSRTRAPEVPIGTVCAYKVPHFLSYKTPLMNWVLDRVRNTPFIVGASGSVDMPTELKDLQITIANATYRMGIGGLHSTEETVCHKADDEYCLVDKDVASYYPMIILNQGLFPEHLGRAFLRVYQNIVDRRLDAKRNKNKSTADTLKIVINGTFGKLSNKFSDLYSPDLGIQVTITGQLTLLMLIERFELEGIQVVSANTDGMTIKCKRSQRQRMDEIVKEWEAATNFETEEVEYLALYSRDVNNYIAVKTDLTVKAKGAYANPWADKKLHSFELHKNPTTTVCIEAVTEYLTKGVPLDHTIQGCKDIRKFVTVRTVQGGAVKDGDFLGKSIRWYYATGISGEIISAKTGNKVPRSDGAKPLMTLSPEFPEDVDYDWYIQEAHRILRDIGAEPLADS